MYKMAKYFASLLIIVIFVVILLFSRKNTINLTIKNKSYRLEIAKTIFQQAKGLSNRNSLCPDCGMIFTFPSESIQPFWMKDTLIPLDIIWLNQQGRVVTIITGKPNDLSILQNTTLAKYVIELNANDAQKLKLSFGDIINLPNL